MTETGTDSTGAAYSLTHSLNLKVTDADGNSAITNTASTPKSSSLASWDAASLNLVWNVTNSGSTPMALSDKVNLPAYLQNRQPWLAASGFDANGLLAGNISGDMSNIALTYRVGYGAYTTAPPANINTISSLFLQGTLALGQSVTLTVPMEIPAQSADKVRLGNFTLFENVRLPGATADTGFQATVDLAKPAEMSDGTPVVPFTGTYVPTIKTTDADGNVSFVAVDELMGKLPAAVNGENYWINN